MALCFVVRWALLILLRPLFVLVTNLLEKWLSMKNWQVKETKKYLQALANISLKALLLSDVGRADNLFVPKRRKALRRNAK